MDSPPKDRKCVSCPRMILCGLRGGSGKTIITLGLIGTLRRRNLRIAPFKKGPDYIDPQWISIAANRPCRNLDPFLMNREQIIESLVRHSRDTDISIIEGNRGLYDGMDDKGTYSTAELAVQLDAPVILIIDCTKITRTVAALVLGCKTLNPAVNIQGVILNRVANSRQERVIRSAVENEAKLPVWGAIRRMKDFAFPERHLGLHPPAECQSPQQIVHRLSEVIEQSLDLDGLMEIANKTAPIDFETAREDVEQELLPDHEKVQIGVIKDEAFHFYYPENLEALISRGAEIREIDALEDKTFPPVDALYIGGGFPEMAGEPLTANRTFRAQLKTEIEDGLPVWAECGGLVYLSEAVVHQGNTFPLVGIFPVTYQVLARPQGHGYTVVEVDTENPFVPKGIQMRGHEFRYSAVEHNRHDMQNSIFTMQRGFGFDGKRDGLLYKNCVASFSHHHAVGNPAWIEGLIRLARQRKAQRDCLPARS